VRQTARQVEEEAEAMRRTAREEAVSAVRRIAREEEAVAAVRRIAREADWGAVPVVRMRHSR
jgi:hypothetical protein